MEGEDGEDRYTYVEQTGKKEDQEMLFLIEFLVDTLTLDVEALQLENLDPCTMIGENCLTLYFLNFPPMNICEKDISPCRKTGGDITKFNAGKSLMFVLSESQMSHPPQIFLEVLGHKTTPQGCLPPMINFGRARIDLTELFTEVFDQMNSSPSKLPATKSMKDTFKMRDDKKDHTADLLLYARLSCLGPNIVTEFQRGEGKHATMLIRNTQTQLMYHCRAMNDKPICKDQEDLCPPVMGGRGPLPPFPKHHDKTCKPPPPYNPYLEYGEDIPGHSLLIKVRKSEKPPPKPPAVNNFCQCALNQAPGAKRGPKGNRIVFKVPADQEVCEKGRGNATLHQVKSCKKRGDVSDEEEPDPNDDVFFLKIGKKGDPCGKGKLELELRTPKQVMLPPPRGPVKFNKRVQTDPEEEPAPK